MKLKLIKLPFQIIGYKLFRRFGWPRLLPINLTLSITNKCNSKCKTCNIWKQKPVEEFSAEEWKKTLQSIGKTPFWFTISGGEPFLNKDLIRIIKYICEYNKPFFINIATNALDSKKIENETKKIIKICEKHKIKLIINVSIDEINEKYDFLRGTILGFNKVLKTIKILKQMQKISHYLNIGINITISNYNVDRFYDIYKFITKEIKPDSIISEMATNRKAFFLTSENISPNKEKYLKVLNFLIKSKIAYKNMTPFLINIFRKKYYKQIKENFLKGKKLNCYAAIASAEILCTGDVVNCCMLAESLGNLRDNNYNFRKIWGSKKAEKIRNKIKENKCYCTLSNPYYTNRIISSKI